MFSYKGSQLYISFSYLCTENDFLFMWEYLLFYKMRKIALFFIFVLIGVVTRAEDNYKNGYIITNTNDTIKGLVDFKMNKINSEICRFKLSEKDKVREYHPYEISGYRFVDEKKYYVSRTITLDSIVKKVFLEYLVQGMKDLYYYQNDNEYYFLEGENGKMNEISKEPDRIVDNKIVSDHRYKGKLMYTFRDCADIRRNVEKGRFDRKTMIELTRKYHEQKCNTGEECIVFENDYKKRFTKVNFIVYGGVEYTKMTVTDDVFFPVTNPSPVIGAELCINDPRISKQFSLRIDFSMSKHNLVKDIPFGTNVSAGNMHYKVKGYQPSLSIGTNYIIFSGGISPFLEAGIGYSTFNGTSDSYQVTYKQTKQVINGENNDSPYDNFCMYSYNAGAGCNFRINDKHFIYWGVNYNRSFSRDMGFVLLQTKVGFAF